MGKHLSAYLRKNKEKARKSVFIEVIFDRLNIRIADKSPTNNTYFDRTNNAIVRKILVIARKRSAANRVSSALGALGRRFESCRPDSIKTKSY